MSMCRMLSFLYCHQPSHKKFVVCDGDGAALSLGRPHSNQLPMYLGKGPIVLKSLVQNY